MKNGNTGWQRPRGAGLDLPPLQGARWKWITVACAAMALATVAYCQTRKPALGGRELNIRLSKKNFPVRFYPPEKHCRGLILLASGDGGWKPFEDKIGKYFASLGWAVAGWDCLRYARSGPYDQATLAADYLVVLESVRRELSLTGSLPVVYAGYSTGAEQVVAAAARPPRPETLAGLLLISPGKRGRYGITTSDLMGVLPSGKGSFAMEDLAGDMDGMRIVQIHGEHDYLDSTDWLANLRVPHELKEYPDGWHFFKGGPPDFLKMLSDATDWILKSPRPH